MNQVEINEELAKILLPTVKINDDYHIYLLKTDNDNIYLINGEQSIKLENVIIYDTFSDYLDTIDSVDYFIDCIKNYPDSYDEGIIEIKPIDDLDFHYDNEHYGYHIVNWGETEISLIPDDNENGVYRKVLYLVKFGDEVQYFGINHSAAMKAFNKYCREVKQDFIDGYSGEIQELEELIDTFLNESYDVVWIWPDGEWCLQTTGTYVNAKYKSINRVHFYNVDIWDVIEKIKEIDEYIRDTE